MDIDMVYLCEHKIVYVLYINIFPPKLIHFGLICGDSY